MNQKQWKKLTHSIDKPKDFWYWRNKAVEYFNLQKGQVIHHLRDTKEQRIFNDNYYERWGFDFNEEMKYCICISKEEHSELHKYSLETKQKMSESAKHRRGEQSNRGRIPYNNGKIMIRLKPTDIIPDGFTKGLLLTPNYFGHYLTKETIEKQQKTKKERGTNKKSLKTRKKMSEAAKKYKKTEAHLQHIREAAKKRKGQPSPIKGIKRSQEFCKKVSEATKKVMNTPEMLLKLKEAREKLKNTPFWTDGTKNKRCLDCPGENWYLGYTYSKKNIGVFWWNNGKIETKSKECPGEGWVKGRLHKCFYKRGMTFKTEI